MCPFWLPLNHPKQKHQAWRGGGPSALSNACLRKSPFSVGLHFPLVGSLHRDKPFWVFPAKTILVPCGTFFPKSVSLFACLYNQQTGTSIPSRAKQKSTRRAKTNPAYVNDLHTIPCYFAYYPHWSPEWKQPIGVTLILVWDRKPFQIAGTGPFQKQAPRPFSPIMDQNLTIFFVPHWCQALVMS